MVTSPPVCYVSPRRWWHSDLLFEQKIWKGCTVIWLQTPQTPVATVMYLLHSGHHVLDEALRQSCAWAVPTHSSPLQQLSSAVRLRLFRGLHIVARLRGQDLADVIAALLQVRSRGPPASALIALPFQCMFQVHPRNRGDLIRGSQMTEARSVKKCPHAALFCL